MGQILQLFSFSGPPSDVDDRCAIYIDIIVVLYIISHDNGDLSLPFPQVILGESGNVEEEENGANGC